MSDLGTAQFKKSSYSGPGGNECVEVCTQLEEGLSAVRDSKDPGRAVITVSGQAYSAFLDHVKAPERS